LTPRLTAVGATSPHVRGAPWQVPIGGCFVDRGSGGFKCTPENQPAGSTAGTVLGQVRSERDISLLSKGHSSTATPAVPDGRKSAFGQGACRVMEPYPHIRRKTRAGIAGFLFPFDGTAISLVDIKSLQKLPMRRRPPRMDRVGVKAENPLLFFERRSGCRPRREDRRPVLPTHQMLQQPFSARLTGGSPGRRLRWAIAVHFQCLIDAKEKTPSRSWASPRQSG